MTSWPLSRITRWCAISFLIGIVVNEWINLSLLWVVVMLWVGILVIFQRRFVMALAIGLCLIFFGVGLARGITAMPTILSQDVSFFNDADARQWEGVIIKEPDVRETKQKLVVRVSEHHEGDNIYHGLILIDAPPYPWFAYGDRVQFKCVIEEPFVAQEFSYKDYLARQGIFSWCRRPMFVLSVDNRQGTWWLNHLYAFKKWMVSGINAQLPEPHSTLLSGILFGARSAFPQSVAENFSIVGLTHIVAISGYNITIVMVAIASLFRAMRVSRKRATWAILIGVTIFTIFTGASSATVRAAMMGGLILIAIHKGRTQSVGHTLLIAAVVMVALSPSLLFHDAGFQLSFLATMGLVYGTPIISRLTDKLPVWKWMKEVSTQTLAATIATIPLIAVQFSSLSLISLFANILILPFIPLSMILGFILVFFNLVGVLLGPFASMWQTIVSPASWGTWLVLEYILKVTEYFSKVPYASVPILLQSWSWVFFVLSYGTMFFIVWSYGRVYPTNTNDVEQEKNETLPW